MSDYSIISISSFEVVIEKKIKESQRGFVYLVRDVASRKRYIYRSFFGNGQVYQNMIGIQCPNLPVIYAVEEDFGKVCVLEEYIQGDSLAFLLEYKPLSEEYTKLIIMQICKGLQNLHSIGAVHRDIKPENIIIRGEDAVLIDFDASRICKVDNETDTRIMGTTGYAAPEQYGFSQTDARTDIYSLGILLNEMLTKQHPSRQLAKGKYRSIIEKCTRINADQRYASVEELLTAIQRVQRKPYLLLAALLCLIAVIFIPVPERSQIAPETVPTETTEIPETTVPATRPVASLPAPTAAIEQPITIEQWEGNTEGISTTFYYDLDGNGTNEKFIFGADYQGSPHDNVPLMDINGSGEGETHVRELFPCVWRINSDGSMEIEEAFTTIMTDTQSNFYRIGEFETPDAVAHRASYKWDGAIRAVINPTEECSYVYEVVTYIGGEKMTAQLVTKYYPRDSFY